MRGSEAHIDYGIGTTEAMRRLGGLAITLECGQHDDPRAPDVAYQAILRTPAHLDMVERASPEPASQPEVIRLTHVGQVLAHRHDGTPLTAVHDGWIVFPNPGAGVNQEWFYLAQASDRLRG